SPVRKKSSAWSGRARKPSTLTPQKTESLMTRLLFKPFESSYDNGLSARIRRKEDNLSLRAFLIRLEISGQCPCEFGGWALLAPGLRLLGLGIEHCGKFWHMLEASVNTICCRPGADDFALRCP